MKARQIIVLLTALMGLGLFLQFVPADDGKKAAELEQQLKALEAMHETGLVTQERYQEMKAAIEAKLRAARAQPDDAAQRKLKALEAARNAGILSEEEYQQKKAVIEAQLRPAGPAIDEETRRKLKALQAARDAGILSETEFARKKAELTAHPAAAAPAGAPAAAIDDPSVRQKGKTYKHAIGFQFWYPDGWTVKQLPGGLQLIPPGAGTSPQGATELYVIIGDAITDPNIKRPDDPAVIAYLDNQVRGTIPFLTRTEKTSPIDMTAGKGAIFNWQGTNPQGKTVRARAYACLLKNYGVALVGIGLEDRGEKRDRTLRQIFTSFGFGANKIDPALVGFWRNEKFYSSGTFSSTTVIDMILRKDGTFARGSRLLASMDHKDSTGMPTGSTNLDTGRPAGERGRWAAGDKTLYLFYADGSSAQYSYYVEAKQGGRSMLLKTANGKKELWQSKN